MQEVGPAAVRSRTTACSAPQPVLFSPVDPHTLYFASNVVWKTLNGGTSWTQISPDLTRETWEVPPTSARIVGTPAAKPSRRGVVYTLAPSYMDINRIWAGTDDGLIHVTATAGTPGRMSRLPS